MGKLAALACKTAKPDLKRDRLLGDGVGSFLQLRPKGTKTWFIVYDFRSMRTKYTIGGFLHEGAPGESISEWLRYGQRSLTQARAIAGNGRRPQRNAFMLSELCRRLVGSAKKASAPVFWTHEMASSSVPLRPECSVCARSYVEMVPGHCRQAEP